MRYLIYILLFSVTAHAQLPSVMSTNSHNRVLDTISMVIPLSERGVLTQDDIIYQYESVTDVDPLISGDAASTEKMLDTSDITFSNLYPTGSKSLDPTSVWNIPIEAVKFGFHKPVETVWDLKHPTRFINIATWRGFKFESSEIKGMVYLGSNDRFTWTPITDTLNWGFSRSFINHTLLDTNTYYSYVKLLKWHKDVNGYTQSGPNGRLKTVFTIVRNNAVDNDTRPETTVRPDVKLNRFTGVNFYYYEPYEIVGKYKAVSQFENETWHFTAYNNPPMILPSYDYRWGFTDNEYNNGNYIGPDSLPMIAVRGGMDKPFSVWDSLGVEFNIVRHQEMHNSYLRDSLNKFFNNGKRVSNHVLVAPKYASEPDYFLTYPRIFVDTLILERDTTPYDFREVLKNYWFDSVWYDIDDADYTNFVTDDYITYIDDTVPDTWYRIEDAMRLHPLALAQLANPEERENIYTDLDNSAEWGRFLFNYTAVYGNNDSIHRDSLYQYNSDEVPLGLGLVHAQSSFNEWPKKWKGGLGKVPPMLVGFQMSVDYDGHMGLAKYKGSHCIGIRTADTTHAFVMPSGLNDDLSDNIEALRWCYYFRNRDFDSAPDFHPCSGLPKKVRLRNLWVDNHAYLNSDANSQNQQSTGRLVCPEEHPILYQLPYGIRKIKSIEPNIKIMFSEVGASSLPSSKSADPSYFLDENDSILDYDLSYCQASTMLHTLFFFHKYADKVFIYEGIEKTVFDPVDAVNKKYDRQAGGTFGGQSGFAGTALYTRIIGRPDSIAGIPKPAAYAVETMLDIMGNSKQISDEINSTDSVTTYTYYDADEDYYTLTVRRYTMRNETTEDFTIDIPSGYTAVTRIEPVRNEEALEVIDLGTITEYTTDVTEKIFFLKCEKP